MTDKRIHGIPSERSFLREVGRAGLRLRYKRPDALMDDIAVALRHAAHWRAIDQMTAVPPLRAIRRACAEWMIGNAFETRLAEPHVIALGAAVHARICAVVERNLGKSATEHQVADNRQRFRGVLDDVVRSGGKVGGALTGRAMASTYALERQTGNHMPAAAATKLQQVYERDRQAGVTRLDIDAWMTHIATPLAEDDPGQLVIGRDGGNAGPDALRRVTYCTPEERWSKCLSVRGGVILDADGEPYHTGQKKTEFSGPGWAIYVVGFDGVFYSESHAVNRFHHSSFFGGAPVKAAGELAVDAGRLVALTNKTGHYRAGPGELAFALGLLRDGGVRLADVAVNDPFLAKGTWVPGDRALAAGGKVAEVDGTVQAPRQVTG